MCERKVRGKIFLAVKNFTNDEVSARCILLNDVGDIFAADIVYHANFMNRYILKFQRDIDEIINPKFETDESFDIVFKEMLTNLDINSRAYSLSDCRDLLNQMLDDAVLDAGLDARVDNRNL